MALHITNPEVEEDVRKLARERGQTITDVIGHAVRELRCEYHGTERHRMTAQEMMAFIRSFPLGPIDYTLSEDEILGYGPNGYCE